MHLVLGVDGISGICYELFKVRVFVTTETIFIKHSIFLFYTQDLLYAYLFQYFMFGAPPNLWEALGLALLMLTCCLHLVEEAFKYRQACMQQRAFIAAETEGDTLVS